MKRLWRPGSIECDVPGYDRFGVRLIVMYPITVQFGVADLR